MPICSIQFCIRSPNTGLRSEALGLGSQIASALDGRWSHRVRTRIPISLLKLFSRTNGLHLHNAINRQNAVEMIDFMLQQLGEISVLTRVELKGLSLKVLIAQSDLPMAFHLHEYRQETQARVPHNDFLLAPLHDLRVDEWPRLRVRELEKD